MCLGAQVMKEMGGTRDTYVGEQTCICSFYEEIDLRDLGIGGRVLLKLILLL